MLAVFCLRLALGMLFALFFLSPSKMHPRFFRTHFVTALGLCVVAAITSFDQTRLHLANVALTLAGSVVWILERPLAGRLLRALSLISIAMSLAEIAQLHSVAGYIADSGVRGDSFWGLLPGVSQIASAALLGFAVTAMLVGHSYLISPGLTIRPLMGQIAGLGIALLARIAVAGAALWFWAGDHDITNLNDINVLWLPVRWLVGFVGPLVFGFMAYRTAKIRSTQSATGILYVVVILTFLGELFGLLLTRNTGLPL
jgi:hypothetical protein